MTSDPSFGAEEWYLNSDETRPKAAEKIPTRKRSRKYLDDTCMSALSTMELYLCHGLTAGEKKDGVENRETAGNG